MSAFLGPIHYWLFHKIKLQNEFVTLIVQSVTEDDLRIRLYEELYEKFGVLEEQPLEEIIDETNIHGWLQERVSIVEYRMAYAVTEILKQKPEMKNKLTDRMSQFGMQHSDLIEVTDVKDVYKKLNDLLLDGMPCDHVNELVSENDKKVTWKRNQCIHKKYWDEVLGDISHYYTLRDAFIQGILAHTDIVYGHTEEGIYTLEKKGE